MSCFEWVSSRALPPRYDLRRRGWKLGSGHCHEPACAVLIDGAANLEPERAIDMVGPMALAVDVASTAARARWLRRGLADAIGPDSDLDELEARALKAIRAGLNETAATALRHGPMVLDRVERDVRVHGRRLGLHPREFALLWRLAQANGRPVSRADLLCDVLGLTIEPETNALAVHVCRLRKKLHLARLSHLLVTSVGHGGGYALAHPRAGTPHIALDEDRFCGEEKAVFEEAAE